MCVPLYKLLLHALFGSAFEGERLMSYSVSSYNTCSTFVEWEFSVDTQVTVKIGHGLMVIHASVRVLVEIPSNIWRIFWQMILVELEICL
jgi:serine acetyltransferase